jgi:hypothetical protein
MFNQMQKTACILLCVKLVGAVLLNQFIVQTEDQNRGSPLPDERASWCRSNIFSIRDVAIDAPAAHKNASEGSFAVCSSMARATGPSLCSMGFVIEGITKAHSCLDSLFRRDRCWDKFSASIKIPSSHFSNLKHLNDRGSSDTAASLTSEFAGALRNLETSCCRSKLEFRNESRDVKEVTLFSVALFLSMSSILCSCANHPLPPSTPDSPRPRIQGEGDIR